MSVFIKILCLVSSAALSADLLHVTFDKDPIGLYSYDSCKAQFPGVKWQDGLDKDSNRVQVVKGGDTAWSGQSLRVSYPANCLGPSGTDGAPSCGAQWKSYFAGTKDTLSLRYWIYFPKNFEWVKGGKLPGLCGSLCNTGGDKPTGDDGWSSRIMWRDSSRLVIYLYHAEQNGIYGTDIDWKDENGQILRVTSGVWHELITRIYLNTPGTNGSAGIANGRIQAWYDGKLAVDTTGFRFRNRDTMHINNFYFSTFYGGKTKDFSPSHDNQIFFDDFLIGDSIKPQNSTSVKPARGISHPFKIHGNTLIIPEQPDSRFQLMTPSGKVVADIDVQSGTRYIKLDTWKGSVLLWRFHNGSQSMNGQMVVLR